MNKNVFKLINAWLLIIFSSSLFAAVTPAQRYCPLEDLSSNAPVKICEIITIPPGPVTQDTPVEVRVVLKNTTGDTSSNPATDQIVSTLKVEAVKGTVVKSLSTVINLNVKTISGNRGGGITDTSRYTVHAFKIKELDKFYGKFSLRVRAAMTGYDEQTVVSDQYFLYVLTSPEQKSSGVDDGKHALPFPQVGWFSPNTLFSSIITRRKLYQENENIAVDKDIIKSTLETAYKIGIRTIVLQKVENVTSQYNGYTNHPLNVSVPVYFYPSNLDLFYECNTTSIPGGCKKQPKIWQNPTISDYGCSYTSSTEEVKPYYFCDYGNKKREVITFDVVDEVLKQAEILKMHVLVGVGRSGDKQLVENISRSNFQGLDRLGRSVTKRRYDNISMMRKKARELWASYGHYRSFYGWYITHETSNLPKIVPSLYEYVANHLKDYVVPAKPVMVAPGGIKGLASASTRDDLKDAIENSSVDIFSYQDRVGANWSEEKICYWKNGENAPGSCNRLNTIASYFKHLSSIHSSINKDGRDSDLKHLWVDMEAWRQKDSGHKYFPASPETMLKQINIESDYVSHIGLFDIGNMLQDEGKDYPGPGSLFRFRNKQFKVKASDIENYGIVNKDFPVHYDYKDKAVALFEALRTKYARTYKDKLECRYDKDEINSKIPGHCP